jgi:hypothetical protein
MLDLPVGRMCHDDVSIPGISVDDASMIRSGAPQNPMACSICAIWAKAETCVQFSKMAPAHKTAKAINMSLTVGRDGGFSKLGSWYSPESGIRVSRDQIASPQSQRSGRSDVFTMRHLIAATFRMVQAALFSSPTDCPS